MQVYLSVLQQLAMLCAIVDPTRMERCSVSAIGLTHGDNLCKDGMQKDCNVPSVPLNWKVEHEARVVPFEFGSKCSRQETPRPSFFFLFLLVKIPSLQHRSDYGTDPV